MNMVMATLLERIEALPFDKKALMVIMIVMCIGIFISGIDDYDYTVKEKKKDDYSD